MFRELLAKDELTAVYETLELPLIPVLVAVERAGIRIDGRRSRRSRSKIEQELAQRTAQIYEMAGGEFNINSPKQLAEILFDKLQLPVLKRTGTSRAPSTAVEVLEELALAHDLPRQILEWRGLMKLKGTYIDALPQLVQSRDRPRAHLLQPGGRRDRTPEQQRSRTCRTFRSAPRSAARSGGAFIADPGHVLISADYSQIEFRVLAHLSDDPVLIDAFREGADFHERTALKIFGADSGRDPHELRSIAKMVNYALLYGKTRVHARQGHRRHAAGGAGIHRRLLRRLPARPRVHRSHARGGARDRRREDDVRPAAAGAGAEQPQRPDRDRRPSAMAVNLPIQGTAADIMKRAMIDVHAALAPYPEARMILTVHDELLFEVPKARAEEVAALVRDKMQSAAPLNVPLTVDVGDRRELEGREELTVFHPRVRWTEHAETSGAGDLFQWGPAEPTWMWGAGL